jgi:hypothetical protein
LSGLLTFVVHGTNPAGNPEARLARLAPAPTLPGNYNGNGTADAADYVVWRKGLGTTFTQNDYDVWRANFGATIGAGVTLSATGSASAAAAIPEPATSFLLLTGLLVAWPLLGRRKDCA